MNARTYSTSADGDLLFDPEILKKLDFSQYASKYKCALTAVHPGSSLLVRPLSSLDYEKRFLQLLRQLTHVGQVTREEFLRRFSAMKICNNTYYVIVIEDTHIDQIVGTGTLVLEQKFIHDAGCRGSVDDVVIDERFRGKELGKLIVSTLSLLAEYLGCYKITVNCEDYLIPFYERLNYSFESNREESCRTMHFNFSTGENPLS